MTSTTPNDDGGQPLHIADGWTEWSARVERRLQASDKFQKQALDALEALTAALAEQRHELALLNGRVDRLRTELQTARSLANITERLARLESGGTAKAVAPLRVAASS
jgi:hypothetical protein